jgi:hypothetical protein
LSELFVHLVRLSKHPVDGLGNPWQHGDGLSVGACQSCLVTSKCSKQGASLQILPPALLLMRPQSKSSMLYQLIGNQDKKVLVLFEKPPDDQKLGGLFESIGEIEVLANLTKVLGWIMVSR